MISNDERHEVARQLRDEFANDFDGTNTRYVRIYDQGVGGISLNRDAAMRLADLIDGPTCEMRDCDIDHGEVSWGMSCSNCGKEFEHQSAGHCGWRYCPSCGAEVVK